MVLAHTGVPGLENGGSVGVTLFFVLSGYLITGLLMAEHRGAGRISLAGFYVRRTRRLLPALVVVVGVVMALGLASPTAAVAVFLYIGNWWYALGGDLASLSHTWTLALEEQFYIAWPLAVILLRGHARQLAIVAGIGIVAAILIRHGLPDGPVPRLMRFDAILLGCLLALTAIKVPQRALWAGLGIVGLAFLPLGYQDTVTIATAGSMLLVGTWRWAPRSLVRLGQISYGLYLWHFPVMLVLTPFLAVPVSLALALASERWIERPFRRRLRPEQRAPELRLRIEDGRVAP